MWPGNEARHACLASLLIIVYLILRFAFLYVPTSAKPQNTSFDSDTTFATVEVLPSSDFRKWQDTLQLASPSRADKKLHSRSIGGCG